MSETGNTGDRSGRLGGLGALFFLGTLATIAMYVQQQEVPSERDLVRKAATMLPQEVEEEKPRALPWEDRLQPSAATVVPFGPTRAAGPQPPAGGTDATSAVDKKSARLVQDLNDGHRILLTLDPVLQDSALTIFKNREVPYAAAVMLDLRDNAVLVMAGHSSMDAEVDPQEIVTAAWAPAASTFKLITTATLLDAGVATPSTRVCFAGGLKGFSAKELADDPARDTRCETLASAIAHSHNLVIGKLALRHLEQAQLAGMAKSLMFEQKIAFELPIERSPAHIPADPIERAKVAAGFWNVDLSPMHAAVLASILARRGIYQAPHLIAQVIGPDGDDVTPARPGTDRVLAREVAEQLGEMMEGTTRSGTARKSFRDAQGNDYIADFAVAGKTGSLTGKKPPALNYNWFIGFAPADRPEIAFAVLLANSPKWRIKAHYAARRLVQIYLERRGAISRQREAILSSDALLLPRRDASGALAAADARPPQGDAGSKTKAGPAAKTAPTADSAPAPAPDDAPAPAIPPAATERPEVSLPPLPPLPPPPGPLPPAAAQLPPPPV